MKKRTFPTSSELDTAFAKCIAEILQKSIDQKSYASILFSGGSTPKGLFAQLSQQTIDWSRVKIGLVDDRMVVAESDFSNSKLIRSNFLDRLPDHNMPTFYPLVTHPFNAANNLANAIKSTLQIGVPDIVVLGMGGDGHFASLFPNDDASTGSLNQENDDVLLYTNAPSNPKFRISHSWNYLRKAKNLFIHVTGNQKVQILETSRSNGERLPIDYLLTDADLSPELYWAP